MACYSLPRMTDNTPMINENRYALSRFASRDDRERAINAEIDRLATKRDHAADVNGNEWAAWSYQVDIDLLAALLEGRT